MCVSVPARNHTEVLARSPESCKQYLMTTWRSERAPLARSRISRPHLAFVCLCVRRCFYDDCHAAAGATPQNSPLAYVSARVRSSARERPNSGIVSVCESCLSARPRRVCVHCVASQHDDDHWRCLRLTQVRAAENRISSTFGVQN